MISPHKHVVTHHLKPCVLGNLPHGHFVPWKEAKKIVGIGWITPDHWVCYEVKLKEQMVIVYDSLARSRCPSRVKDAFKQALQNLYWVCTKCDLIPEAKTRSKGCFNLTIERDIPQQGHTHNCAIFALKYMECLATGTSLKVLDPSYMDDMRKQLCVSIFRAAVEDCQKNGYKSLV